MNETTTPSQDPVTRSLCDTRSFKGVSPETIKKLVQSSELLIFPAGATLIASGDPYQELVYTLVEGDVVMRRANGRVDHVLPGDFIGLANYLDNQDYSSQTKAVTEASVLRTKAEKMHELEQEQPDLFNALNRVIAAKLRERSPDRTISSGALAQPVTRVMKSPVATCSAATTLEEAFLIMNDRRIGSLLIQGDQDELIGVLTFAGLAGASLVIRAAPGDSVMRAVFDVPRVIDLDTPLWEAEELMKRFSAKYLIVVDGATPVGIVSQSDILRMLVSRPSTLSNRIKEARDTKELIALSQLMTDVAVDAQETHHRPSDAVRLLSETHLMLQRRTVEMTLEWMEHKGHGKPPADYALIVMGSGGRREMLLNPDQDNGIIIADSDDADAEAVDAWFEKFSKRVNKNLDRVGYILCPGEIMARNPMFRKTISKWKKQISNVTKKPTEKAARWANVLFDFDTLYGNDALTSELRRHAVAEVQKRPRLLKMMSDHDLEGRPAIGIFNQLLTVKNQDGEHIDIKRNGLRIITDVARIFALQNSIALQNTSDRLSALVRKGKLSEDFKDSVQEAYEELLDLLLCHQIRQAQAGKNLDKLIKPKQLTPQSRSTLRMAMRAVKRFQEQLQDDYSEDIF